jgi:hypothetical protein
MKLEFYMCERPVALRVCLDLRQHFFIGFAPKLQVVRRSPVGSTWTRWSSSHNDDCFHGTSSVMGLEWGRHGDAARNRERYGSCLEILSLKQKSIGRALIDR